MAQGWVQRAHSAGHPRRLPDAVAGDKGYSYPGIGRWCRAARVRAIIPTRRDQPHAPGFDRRHYRKRNRVERLIGRLKQHRRIATRYEKRGQHYFGMVLLAAVLLWLR